MEKEIENILSLVSELYLKFGVKSVTMDDVSRHLGMSKKTLYQYVKDKNELVKMFVNFELEKNKHLFESVLMQNLNSIEELFEINKFIRKLIASYNPALEYDLEKYYPTLYTEMLKIRRERAYFTLLRNIEKGKEEGYYRSELNTDIIAKLYISRMEQHQHSKCFTTDDLSSLKVFNEMFIYHLRGICNTKGIEFLEQKLSELKYYENE